MSAAPALFRWMRPALAAGVSARQGFGSNVISVSTSEAECRQRQLDARFALIGEDAGDNHGDIIPEMVKDRLAHAPLVASREPAFVERPTRDHGRESAGLGAVRRAEQERVDSVRQPEPVTGILVQQWQEPRAEERFFADC